MRDQRFFIFMLFSGVLMGLWSPLTVSAEPLCADLDCRITYESANTSTFDLTAVSSGGGVWDLTCPDGTIVQYVGPQPEPNRSTNQSLVILAHCDGHMGVQEEPQDTYDPSLCVITPSQSAAVREGPGDDSTLIGELAMDEVFIATGFADGGWFFGSSENIEGWLSQNSIADSEGPCSADDLEQMDVTQQEEVVLPPQEEQSSSNGLCMNVSRLRTDPDPIERNLVIFFWSSDADPSSIYELVIYGENGTQVNNAEGALSTFRTTFTNQGVNLGEWPIGTQMSWEVRLYTATGEYQCVTDNSGFLFVNADSNPPPVQTEEPAPPPPQVDCDEDIYNEECQ